MDQNCPGNIRGKSLQAMTTEQLEELLRQEQDTDGMPDVELIEAVLAVLDARGEAPKVDVNATWDDFQSNYSFEAPLYPVPDKAFDRTKNRPDTPDKPNSAMPKPKLRKRVIRTVIAVAAVLVLLIGSAMTVSGLNIWEAIVQWTSETFGLNFGKFEKKTVVLNPELTELYRTVTKTEEHPQIVPRYLPDGYTCKELTADGKQIVAVFVKDDSCIFIQYLKISSGWNNGEQFQRDDGSAEEYVSGGITHYVSTNRGKIIGVWAHGGWECSILGAPSKKELLRMIDSIYLED